MADWLGLLIDIANVLGGHQTYDPRRNMSEPLLSAEAAGCARVHADRWGRPVSVVHVLPNVLLLVIANGFVTPGLPAVLGSGRGLL